MIEKRYGVILLPNTVVGHGRPGAVILERTDEARALASDSTDGNGIAGESSRFVDPCLSH